MLYISFSEQNYEHNKIHRFLPVFCLPLDITSHQIFDFFSLFYLRNFLPIFSFFFFLFLFIFIFFKPFLTEKKFPLPDSLKESLEKINEKIKDSTGRSVLGGILGALFLGLLVVGWSFISEGELFCSELVNLIRKIEFANNHIFILRKDIDQYHKSFNGELFSINLKNLRDNETILYDLLEDFKEKLLEFNLFSSHKKFYINNLLNINQIEVGLIKTKEKYTLKCFEDYKNYCHQISLYFHSSYRRYK